MIYILFKKIRIKYLIIMDFKDQLKQLSDKIEKLKDQIATEEATNTSLIMPFIQAFGFA